ncbi:MAG: RodZ domain-containing protein [Synechococcaceae cyanobacterium]
MSDSSQAPLDAGDAGLAPDRPAGVISATPAQGQLLEAHQRQLRELGAELRQARQARGLSLEALAERLRLGQEQLQALEEGDTRHLPELVFVIDQLRRVAGALQVDLGDKLAQLRGRSPAESGAPFRPSAPASPVARRHPFAAQSTRPGAGPALASSRPTRRWPLMAGLAIPVVALAAALVFGLVRRGEQGTPVPSGRLDPSSSPTPATATATATARATARARAPAPAPAPATPATPATPAAALPLAAPAGEPSLNLQAQGSSWLEVRSGSGEVLYRGFFNGSRRFPLRAGLRVLAGRPDLIEVAGSGQPARTLGPNSAVVWTTFPAPVSAPPATPSNEPTQAAGR